MSNTIDIPLPDGNAPAKTHFEVEKPNESAKEASNDLQEVDSQPRTKPFIVMVASCAALGGLIFGYDIGGAGATFVMDGFMHQFQWKCAPDALDCVPKSTDRINLEKGMINAFFGIGAMIGALINPYFADKIGRRKTLGLCNLVFILGASMQTASSEINLMWAGRVFSGMGIGMLSMVVPVYISECAPEHMRGRLGTLWQVAVTLGILMVSGLNIAFEQVVWGWRLSYGGNILFSLILLLALLCMPESPRWLAANGTEEQLLSALKKVRYEEDINREMIELRTEAEDEKLEGISTWGELFSKENSMRYRVLLGMSLQLFQQLCGINAIMFYAPDILNKFFTQQEAIIGTFVLNTINFLATFIAVWAVDRYGRVKLLTTGGVIMLLALIANAVLSAQPQTLTIGQIVVVFAALFIVGFAYSWGPVVWVVCSEMFPLRARGKATGLTTGTNWIATTLVGAIFPAASTASLSGCFAFFAIMIAIGTTVVHMLLVETANKTIIEIDEKFANHEPRLNRWKHADPADKRPLRYESGSLKLSLKVSATSGMQPDFEKGN